MAAASELAMVDGFDDRYGEDVVYRAKLHWSYIAVAVIALVTLGAFVIGILIFADRMMRRATTEVTITREHVLYATGWPDQERRQIALSDIKSISLDQGAVGRLLDFGAVRIAGSGSDPFTITGIANPSGMRRAIETAQALQNC